MAVVPAVVAIVGSAQSKSAGDLPREHAAAWLHRVRARVRVRVRVRVTVRVRVRVRVGAWVTVRVGVRVGVRVRVTWYLAISETKKRRKAALTLRIASDTWLGLG